MSKSELCIGIDSSWSTLNTNTMPNTTSVSCMTSTMGIGYIS